MKNKLNDFIKSKEEEFEKKYGLVEIKTGEKFPRCLVTKEVQSFIHQALQEAMIMGVKSVEIEMKDEGGRQSKEQTNTWYPNNPYSEGWNLAISDLEVKKAKVIKEINEPTNKLL